MKFKRSTLIIMAILALLPIAVTLYLYPSLPEQIPMQWGFDGKVSRYDDKHSIFGMLSLSPIFAVLFPIMPKIDPRKQNYEKFSSAYEASTVVLLLFLAVMDFIVLSESFYPNRISVSTVTRVGVGLMFVFLGNIMPKVKSNFYMGMRSPWALSDPDVWNKTHRLGGHLMFGCGIFICISPFIMPEKASFFVIIAATLIISLIPATASFIWYRQRHKSEDE